MVYRATSRCFEAESSESAAGDVRARADQGFSLYADNFENEISEELKII